MRWLGFLALVGTAARTASACPDAGGKAIQIARGSVAVDGELDDATWQSACFVDDFEQKTPHYQGKPTHPVRTAVAIDGDTLYVAARMWSDGRRDIDDALTQRDDTAQAERFIVSIDPSHTKRIAFSFAVTAAGVRADWIHTDDSEGARDASWNPVWTAKSKILADGWQTEMAIPLSQLRLPKEPVDSWGIDFDWYIPHRNEDVFWRAVPPDRTAWASYFGQLVALPAVHQGVGVEMLPYVAGSVGATDAVNGGVDVKLHPLPGLVVSATVNPDFGQVDADPAIVNLTAYEISLPEKRPFFVENNSLLSNSAGPYFYSRRIGGLPRGGTTLPAYDDVTIPSQIRILGATAVGGYIAPRTQIAALGAVTEETHVDEADGTPIVVSPLTGWFAGRLEQQTGASVIGVTATAVERRLDGTGLEGLLARSALVGSIDARLRDAAGSYELFPYATVSTLAGTAAAITTIEQQPQHYFQRPDETEQHLDTTARHLTGMEAGVQGTKRAGFWQGELGGDLQTPGLEVNDFGLFQSADDIDIYGDFGPIQTRPGDHLLSWGAYMGFSEQWNFAGVRKPLEIRGDVKATALNFWNGSLFAAVQLPGTSDDITRGGPLMDLGWASEIIATASTPNGRAKQLSASFEADLSPTLRRGVLASMSLSARLRPNVRLDVGPSLKAIASRRQYVTTIDDDSNADTFGSRYVFGSISQREAAIDLRATWSLSPDLVFTLYAQPFASVGRYDDLGELVAASSGQVRSYGPTVHRMDGTRSIADGMQHFTIAEPDFTVVALRSTAVLRWELKPGSTLFVVWQQSRGGAGETVAHPLHDVVGDVVNGPAVHTVAVKLSYWFQ